MKKLVAVSLLLIVVVLFLVFIPGQKTIPKVTKKSSIQKSETMASSTSSASDISSPSTTEKNIHNITPTQKVQLSADQETNIHTFLSNWQDAWQKSSGPGGNIDTYISFYSDDFKAAGLDKKGWADNKGKRNRQKEWIKVSFNDITIQILGDEITAQVIFRQNYNSSNYSDISMKQLTIRNEANEWKILSEQ